ncbi:hypothetical protein [Streptomyces sp. TBY4]|uniref:hypothetical protein n=1 Tax=Streptomyces sp. TBY4 TaxID=2962030 RepID=UPI0020B75A42|nr:hypothetical protein [Streptomyces sp. TBY4]MCP3759738.1 hypothetical protein [Streptomyces sp. TBY4]
MNPTLHLHLVAAAPADTEPNPYVYELADRAKAAADAAYAMRHAHDAADLSERRESARQAAEDLVDAAASLFA